MKNTGQKYNHTTINVFTELGFGNPTLVNTEFEFPDGSEIRKPGFTKMKFRGIYFRVWLNRRVFILSSKNGFVIQTKPKSKIKFLFGFFGTKMIVWDDSKC